MAERSRPDPDALLAQAKGHAKGRLKVFLGMAAGVGKTYSMLQAAQEDRKRGIDVVIGYLEPHGRAETEAMADGLERIPLLRLTGGSTPPHNPLLIGNGEGEPPLTPQPPLAQRGGAGIIEFDVDAALRRKPEKVLVDELAHTNATGSRHAKRWQDVQELLQAGIDVDTTVNIQHVESLNDVVAQITGVRVNETVPDAVLNGAHEVELVDIPPDELISRLREGKVYVPEKVEQALESFFKKRNLLALRELALRRTAERVEEQVRTARAAEGAVQPWHTNERILVCVAPNRMASRVVRAATRLAGSLHTELIAAFVESARQASLTDTDRQRAAEAMRLTESLGGRTVTLSGQDIVGEILRYAQSQNVTTIVVGKPVRPRWREVFFGSVVDSLVRRSGDIDIHVITASEELGTPLRLLPHRQPTDWHGMIMSGAVVAACTGLGVLLTQQFSLANIVMVYLLGVTYVASRYSRNAAVLASILSVAAFDFCFVPPQWTFAVSDIQYVFTFGVMLAVALFISTLTARIKEHSEAASERERRTAALFELSKKLSSTRSRREIGAFAAETIRTVFNCDVAVLIRSRQTGKLFAGPESQSKFESGAREQGVAEWVKDHGLKAGQGTDTLPAAEGVYYPLNGERSCVGVLALKWDGPPPTTPSQVHLLETFANQLAVAIERTNMAKDSHEASIEAERERLRSTLLSSVSHDLRTPLSVIVASSEELRGRIAGKEPENAELAESIAKEATRLERQVRDLLDMTRLESGSLQLRKNWQSLEEMVGSALLRTESLLGEHKVHVQLDSDLPLLWVDQVLMEQVLVNVLENAARYTPSGTNIWIAGRLDREATIIELSNDGPSPSETDLDTMFAKFGRGDNAGIHGAGLGLAICRAIVEAHDGAISASPHHPSGVSFTIRLPNAMPPPEVPLG